MVLSITAPLYLFHCSVAVLTKSYAFQYDLWFVALIDI